MFIADYMEDFKCIGADCEDTCCAGWQVTIDKRTFKHYQKTQIQALKPLFKKHLVRNRKAANTLSFAKIEMDKSGACPLLSTEGLCQVQQHMGEKALSKTCRTYPRIHNIVDSMQETSGSVSCPEIARLALLNPDGIGFKEANINTEGQMLYSTLSTFDATPGTPAKYFWNLQLACIELLKNRSASLWKRLVVLGFFCRKIDEQGDALSAEFIEKIAGDYMTLLADSQYNQSLENLPTDLKARYGMLEAIFTNLGNSNNQRFQACHEQAMSFLLPPETTENESAAKFDELEIRYTQALSDHYLPFMQEHHYILENYMVNYAFRTLFPAKPDDSAFNNYLTLVVNFAVLRSYLVGLAGAQQTNFTTDSALTLIQSFAKLIEHNEIRIRQIRQFFIDKGYASMPHMSILLKEPALPETPATEKTATAPFVKMP